MTPRKKMLAALERKPIEGLVPHFELEFFLTMEAFGRVHPSQRHFHQWDQMSETERTLHREDIADLYVQTCRRFGLSGTIYNMPGPWTLDDVRQSLEHVRKIDGMNHITCLHGDSTYSLPSGDEMMDFVMRLADKPQEMKDDAQKGVDKALETARQIKTWGVLDVFALCSDYCFNDNPFLSPDMFGEFVAPYLKQLVAGYKEMGFYVIKHTDGNIMPILDQIMDSEPHALHSLDPQGGVDIAEVKRLYGDKVCLIGNVNCAHLQTGSEADVYKSVRYALESGMPGYGYVFATSNCIYTGMPLERYELMRKIWEEEGIYPGEGND